MPNLFPALSALFKRQVVRTVVLGSTIGLLACAQIGVAERQVLQGLVSFEAPRSIQAAAAEVGTAATVSLIDPVTNRTMASTLTKPDTSFSLAISGFTPAVQTYYLEAVKGLSSNLAGHDAARLRTLVQWDGTNWHALTTLNASIGVSTTALAAIVSLRATHIPVDPATLIDKLTLGTPDVFLDPGTGITQAEFSSVCTMVSQSLAADRDPLAGLSFDGTTYHSSNSLFSQLPYISSTTPNPVAIGASLTVHGGNFTFPPNTNSVTVSGALATPNAGDERTLVFTIPASASTGLLSIGTPAGTVSCSIVITPPVGGALMSPGLPSPPATTPGTDVAGSIFSRLVGEGGAMK